MIFPLLPLLLVGAVLAQSPQATPQAESHWVAVRTTGSEASAITADEVQAKVDGRAIDIKSAVAQREKDPLLLGVVLDFSHSSRDELNERNNFAESLIYALVRQGLDAGFVTLFDTEFDISKVFRNPEEMIKRIRAGRSGGGTALFDAIFNSCLYIHDVQRQPRPGWVLLVFSDGDDNRSNKTSEEAIHRCQDSGTAIFSFVPNGDSPDRGGRVMKSMASATGGEMYFGYSKKSEPKVAAHLTEVLRTTTLLELSPPVVQVRGKLELRFKTKQKAEILAPSVF